MLAIFIFGVIFLVQAASFFGRLLGWRRTPKKEIKPATGVWQKQAGKKVYAAIEAKPEGKVVKEAETPAPGAKAQKAMTTLCEAVRVTARKSGSDRVEFFDEKRKRIGFAVLGEDWGGARLASLFLAPNEEKVAAELRPLRAKEVGVLCAAFDPASGAELAMVGTIFKKPEWHGSPKPIYDVAGSLLVEFREVEAQGGLAAAKLCSADGDSKGSFYAKGGNEWVAEFSAEAPAELRVLLLAVAQLIGEQAK